jgi:hypothetical protein
MDALIRADFTDAICAPERLAAWSALWAEAQSRPIYQDNCAEFDLEYLQVIERLCAELTAEGNYPSRPGNPRYAEWPVVRSHDHDQYAIASGVT